MHWPTLGNSISGYAMELRVASARATKDLSIIEFTINDVMVYQLLFKPVYYGLQDFAYDSQGVLTSNELHSFTAHYIVAEMAARKFAIGGCDYCVRPCLTATYASLKISA